MKHSVIIKNLVMLSLIASSSLSAFAHVNTPGSYRVEITMNAEQREALKADKKTEVTDVDMKVYKEGQLTDEEKVRLSSRGQSSIKFPRKNLSVKVLKDEEGGKKKLKVGGVKSTQLVMSASPEDILFIKNKIGYSLLKAIGIHSLKTQFAEVEINGKSQGLYMVTENQTENLMKEKDADIVLRRRYNDALEIKDAKKELSQDQIAKYQKTLKAVHKSIRDLSGDQLISALEKNLNLKNYLKWIAFNYIMKNGDYSDEVYFYGKTNPETNEIVFDVSPWDMDDTFSDKMHLSSWPGGADWHMTADSSKQLMYNYESRIDRKVASDEKLLRMYFEAMDEVVMTLSQPTVLNDIRSNILTELNPYLDDADIQANGQLDSIQKAHSRAAIEDDITLRMGLIKLRLQTIKEELVNIKTEETITQRLLDFSALRRVLVKLNMVLVRQFTK